MSLQFLLWSLSQSLKTQRSCLGGACIGVFWFTLNTRICKLFTNLSPKITQIY